MHLWMKHFAIAIGDLRVKRPNLFEWKNEDKSKQWSVATWSRKLGGTDILEFLKLGGTESILLVNNLQVC